jgi:hypothetical protein
MGIWGDHDGNENDDTKASKADWGDLSPNSDSNSLSNPWKEDSDPFLGKTEWKEDINDTDFISKGIYLEVPASSPTTTPKGPRAESIEERNRRWKGGGLLELQQKHGWPMTCTIIAGSELMSGAMAGGAIGAFMGVQRGMAEGGMGPDFTRILRASVLSNAISIGVSLAIWKGTTCASLGIRKKHDIVNEAIGGFTAGMVFALPSRNPMNIAFSGLSYGALSCILGVVTGQYKM